MESFYAPLGYVILAAKSEAPQLRKMGMGLEGCRGGSGWAPQAPLGLRVRQRSWRGHEARERKWAL